MHELSSPRRSPGRALAVVAAILGVAALGLNWSAAQLRLNFQKQAVEPAKLIQSIPARIGPWLMVSDVRFPAEIEHELGTLDYVSRTYVDTRKADTALVAELDAATTLDPALIDRVAADVMSNDPLARVSLHVAYYTGSVDTVPHVPERCMLGNGFNLVGRETATLPVPASAAKGVGENGLPVSLVSFQQGGSAGGGGSSGAIVNRVAYFFHVNGDLEHDALTGVRKRLQNLLETHAYFAKVEIGSIAPAGEAVDQDARAALADFLTFALPEVEACMPDWEQVVADAR